MTWSPGLNERVVALREQLLADEETPDTYREAAQAAEGLPVHCDMGGCLVVGVDGVVFGYDFENRKVEIVTDERWRRRALVKAARRYPDLVDALPQRPPDATRCPACSGTGQLFGRLDCAECEGLGWTTQ